MKKLILLVTMVIASVISAHAQTDTVMYITEMDGEVHNICFNRHERAIVIGPNGCDDPNWLINYNQQFTGDSIILDGNNSGWYSVQFSGWNCGQYSSVIYFKHPTTPCETTDILWKHQDETLSIVPVGADSLEMYDFHWNTGEITPTIEVTEPGTYTCDISDMCATATRTFIVRDNVEIYRSGVDPASNKNRVLWHTIPAQAEYISSVKIERDGMVVGTAPYTDGQFLDNIGSENAARIYRITGIASDGTECPLPSYRFGTFNTIISPDIANPSLMNFTWEDPFVEEGSPYSIVAYRIGRFNEATGEFIAIDQVSAQVHIAKYNMDLFDGDYGLVAAVFSDAKNRDYEELAFSNRSDSGIVGIGEQNSETFGIYPNPAKGRFTVEGTGTMTVTNTLGQTVLTQEIDEKATVELPQGMYFVKLGGATRKVVVE